MQGPSNLGFFGLGRLLLLVAVAAVFTGCARSPTEQALRDRIDAMQSAAEQREMGEFMDGVAEDFAGNSSEFDRDGLQRLLRMIALRHQSIGVTRMALKVEMHGDRAVVRMQILVTGGSGGFIPEQGQLFDTESAWRFVDGEWQLGSAQWQPVR